MLQNDYYTVFHWFFTKEGISVVWLSRFWICPSQTATPLKWDSTSFTTSDEPTKDTPSPGNMLYSSCTASYHTSLMDGMMLQDMNLNTPSSFHKDQINSTSSLISDNFLRNRLRSCSKWSPPLLGDGPFFHKSSLYYRLYNFFYLKTPIPDSVHQ